MRKDFFNLDALDYEKPETKLFLGKKEGLVNTLHQVYPKLWDIYKRLKAQDWDELEFPFYNCKKDFNECNKVERELMVKTLAWQWEADSLVGNSLYTILEPFISNTELKVLYMRINDNENIHALTYSEIIKQSFSNPDEVLQEVLNVNDAKTRLNAVGDVFELMYGLSSSYRLNPFKYDYLYIYRSLMKFIITVLALERIQFMASFAVTFKLHDNGLFIPIGEAVNKICQDELFIHVETGKEIINIERKNGLLEELLDDTTFIEEIKIILKEIIDSELNWVDYLMQNDTNAIVGLDTKKLKDWVLWCAKDVIEFLDLMDIFDYNYPVKDPLPFMTNKYLYSSSSQQGSPQEERKANYFVGGFIEDDTDKIDILVNDL